MFHSTAGVVLASLSHGNEPLIRSDFMPNLYQDTAEPAVTLPPLDADRRADVVIVGGGFTGLSAALSLAEGGASVVLLETHEPGWGASGRNGGQVNPGLKHEPDVVERDFGPDLGSRMVALAGAAPALVFDLIARHSIRCDARRNGTLRAAIRSRSARKLDAAAEQLLRRGAPVELLDGNQMARMTGNDRYVAGLLDRRGGDLNPLSFARGLARAAVGAGAAVHGSSRVSSLSRVDGGWQARTASGTVTADRVVLATNGYTDDLWPSLRRTVVPLFGAIVATAAIPREIAAGIMPSRAVLYETGTVTVYYRVDGGERLLIGGRGPMREITTAAAVPHLLAYAHELWPALRPVPWTHAWGGRLAMTTDQYPHIHEPASGVIACLGYNGRGVALGTAMGVQLAQRILKPSAPFDMPVSPMQTIAFHSLWPVAVRAAIARGRLCDALGI
jgi:glycine/D-amino acid oxidase-like deaminating enzyme